MVSMTWEQKCKNLNAQLKSLLHEHNEDQMRAHKEQHCMPHCGMCAANKTFDSLTEQLAEQINVDSSLQLRLLRRRRSSRRRTSYYKKKSN